MINRVFVVATTFALLSSCGGKVDIAPAPDEFNYCPVQENVTECHASPTYDISISELAGVYFMRNIILPPDGSYRKDYYYAFNEDGTYVASAFGIQPILPNCLGYSDGGGSYSEMGNFTLNKGVIYLMPEKYTSDYSEDHQSNFTPYEIRVNKLDYLNGELTLSGPDFCNKVFPEIHER